VRKKTKESKCAKRYRLEVARKLQTKHASSETLGHWNLGTGRRVRKKAKGQQLDGRTA